MKDGTVNDVLLPDQPHNPQMPCSEIPWNLCSAESGVVRGMKKGKPEYPPLTPGVLGLGYSRWAPESEVKGSRQEREERPELEPDSFQEYFTLLLFSCAFFTSTELNCLLSVTVAHGISEELEAGMRYTGAGCSGKHL